MNRIKKILWLLMIVGMAAALYSSMTGEQTPDPMTWGSVALTSGSWSDTADAAVYTAPLDRGTEQAVLLKSQWKNYEVLVDETPVYTTQDEKSGTFHLFSLPAGQTLTVRFFRSGDAAETVIRQSEIYLGSKGGMYRALLRENLYALVAFSIAMLLGCISIVLGLYMRRHRFGNFSGSMLSLGIYILAAGIWVLTDSSLLLLVTQKSGFVALLSFLSFYAMHIPLLQFTIRLLPTREKMLALLQYLFTAMFFLLIVNYIGNFHLLAYLLVVEHLLMVMTLVLMMYFGFSELRRRKSKVLGRVMVGYSVFALCSLTTLAAYYFGATRLYSRTYVLGILGFIFCLADAAWQEILEQIRKNAQIAVYAEMAYRDQMTGMGNRAAFSEEGRKIAASADSLGYIMMDLNDLKRVNDTLGHQQGDALIVLAAQCIRDAVGKDGSCCRIGGDEFVVAMKDCGEQAVQDCAARIREAVRRADAEGAALPLSIALGCAWSRLSDAAPETIFKRADDAMYADKKRMKACRRDG